MKSISLLIFFLLSVLVSRAQHKKVQPADEYNQVFTRVEVVSGYKKGKNALLRYLQTQLRYPEEARKKRISGTVTVQFIVTKLGDVSEVKAVSGPEALRPEAVRLIKESGEWTPAIQCGRYVKSFHTQDVVFAL